MSGWVLVNLESTSPISEKPSTMVESSRLAQSSSHPSGSANRRQAPSMQHQRSHSDSRVHESRTHSPRSTVGSGAGSVGRAPAASTMSAAAKTIAMIDAVEAREHHKSPPQSSGLRRLFQRVKGLDVTAQEAQHSMAPVTATGAPSAPNTFAKKSGEKIQVIASSKGKEREVESDERRSKPKAVPAVSARPHHKRMSLS